MLDLLNIETIGRYEILKKIGQGSKGAVYLGRDPYIERQVAVKTYRLPENIEPEQAEGYQKKYLGTRFCEENVSAELCTTKTLRVWLGV